MQPLEYALEPELKQRIETSLEAITRDMNYKEWNYPLVNKMAVLFGNSKKVCKALEAAFGVDANGNEPDYARYGLKPPTSEERQQAQAFLEALEQLAQGSTNQAYVLKGLPQDSRLSLLAMGLPYFFGDATNQLRTGNINDKNGYPRYIKADRVQRIGKALETHAKQRLHIDGEASDQHIYSPGYMLRFMASRGKGDVNLPTNIYSIDEFIAHVAEQLLAHAPNNAFVKERLGETPSHQQMTALIEEALCKPIWPAPTVPAIHGNRRGNTLQPLLLRDQQGGLFIHHFKNTLNTLDSQTENPERKKWRECLLEKLPAEEVEFYDTLAQAMQRARSEMKLTSGIVLQDGQMLIYNDRRVVHGPGRLEEGADTSKARKLINTSAYRTFDPQQSQGTFTPRR